MELERLINTARRKTGLIDIVIASAGVKQYFGPSSTTPEMVAKRSQSIIFTSYMGVFKPSKVPGKYEMSRMTLEELVLNIAKEFGPKALRCNAICLGLIKTEISSKLQDYSNTEEYLGAETPFPKDREPKHSRRLAVCLASDPGGHKNEQAHTVCCGSNVWV